MPQPTKECLPSRPCSTDSSRNAGPPVSRSRTYAPSGLIRSAETTAAGLFMAIDCRHGPLRDRFRRPHPVREARRRARRLPGDRARRARDQGCARPRRRRRRRDRVRDHGPGAAGRRGAGAGAPGGDRRRSADRAAVRHDQQGLRVEHPRGRDRRPDDPLGRPQRDRRRRDGVDVERAVRAEEGAVRLQARRRLAGRPDGARRAHVGLRRQAHGRAGVVRRTRAGDHAGGTGRVGAAVAAAGGRRAGRGPVRRRDRRGRRGHGRRRPASATPRWRSSRR